MLLDSTVGTLVSKWMVVLTALFSTGLQPVSSPEALLPVYYEDQVIVLMYHHIDPSESNSVIISPEQFESHMQMLRDKGYQVISMDQFMAFNSHEEEVPANAVLITFDDGYESFYTYAAPTLEKYDFVGTHFIVGETTDHVNPDAYPHLSWDQMRELKTKGMSFYNHTYDMHRQLPIDAEGAVGPMLTHRLYLDEEHRQETDKEYRDRLRQDLSFMNSRLDEELGKQEYRLLCFPFGAYNETVLEVGDELGFDVYFTTERGINKAGQSLIYRMNAGSPDMTAERLLHDMEREIQKQRKE